MNRLTHITAAAGGLEAARKNLDNAIQEEIKEAKRLQKQLRCTWTEALTLAKNKPSTLNPNLNHV